MLYSGSPDKTPSRKIAWISLVVTVRPAVFATLTASCIAYAKPIGMFPRNASYISPTFVNSPSFVNVLLPSRVYGISSIFIGSKSFVPSSKSITPCKRRRRVASSMTSGRYNIGGLSNAARESPVLFHFSISVLVAALIASSISCGRTVPGGR